MSHPLLMVTAADEENIERERIVDGDSVPEEYFCPICQYLLWKPQSCSTCQQLFCQQCIRTWLENPNSQNRCPFRCEPFEQRRCPPYVQSLLSRLNIRCRNAVFGCTEIVSYDRLEHHETVECQYLSERCTECDRFVLISKVDEHQQMPGLCTPRPIKCTICENFIDKVRFREHFHECCQRRIAELNQGLLLQQAQTNTNINLNVFFQSIVNTGQIFARQKQMSRLPTTLKGVDAVQWAREQNRSRFYHVLIMFRFLFLNWRKAPLFLIAIFGGGFLSIAVFLLCAYTIFCCWTHRHIYIGLFVMILYNFILGFGIYFICQLFSDATIISIIGLVIFLLNCTPHYILEELEMNVLFNKPLVCISINALGLLLMKITLLFIRFSYSLLSVYVVTGLLIIINFYIGIKIYHVYSNAVTARANQPLITV